MTAHAPLDAAQLAPPREVLDPLRRRAIALAALGLAAALVGFLVDPERFWRAWLTALLLPLGVATGSLALALLHRLTGGQWGLVLRRPLEAAARTLPLLALLFLPLFAGLQRLYPWARPEQVAADPVLQHRAPWMDTTPFALRAALCFAAWIATGLLITRLSGAREARLRALAAPALALWVLLMSSAAVDWLMSLDPHWTSSLFGTAFLTGAVLSALAFAVLVTTALAPRPPLSGRVLPRHLHDLGKLLLAFVLLFAYFAFSQFLLVWSADLPDEVAFYLRRAEHGWSWVAGAVALLHFAVPFVILLGRRAKRSRVWLLRVCVLLLLMRWVDLQWHVAPTDPGASVLLHWIDLAAALGVGALFVAVFTWQLGRHALLPHDDPALEAALAHD